MDNIDLDWRLVERAAALLGLDPRSLKPCDIYLNYVSYYISRLERRLQELRERVYIVEEACRRHLGK